MVAHARGRSADGAMMIPTMHSYELNKLKIPDAVLIYRNLLTSQRGHRFPRIISLRFAEHIPNDSL
jgi:hypothetical protein